MITLEEMLENKGFMAQVTVIDDTVTVSYWSADMEPQGQDVYERVEPGLYKEI